MQAEVGGLGALVDAEPGAAVLEALPGRRALIPRFTRVRPFVAGARADRGRFLSYASPMIRRTPQEKKQLSYARDRRNDYGENDKSSRTSIPARKRRANRVNRRLTGSLLAGATGDVDPVLAESVETNAGGRRPQRWTKVPDIPLGVHLERKRRRSN